MKACCRHRVTLARKKRRRVTKDKEETIKTMRKQALDEVQFMMQNMNNNLQTEDFWKKVTDTE